MRGGTVVQLKCATLVLGRSCLAGLDDAELLLWALQCVVDFGSVVTSLVDEEFGISETSAVVPRCDL